MSLKGKELVKAIKAKIARSAGIQASPQTPKYRTPLKYSVKITSKPQGEPTVTQLTSKQVYEQGVSQGIFDVIQASKNFSRVPDSKTFRLIPNYTPISRKGHDGLGYVQVYHKRSLSSVNDSEWVRGYKDGINYQKEKMKEEAIPEQKGNFVCYFKDSTGTHRVKFSTMAEREEFIKEASNKEVLSTYDINVYEPIKPAVDKNKRVGNDDLSSVKIPEEGVTPTRYTVKKIDSRDSIICLDNKSQSKLDTSNPIGGEETFWNIATGTNRRKD